jgi:hypothetical protein
VCDSGAVSDGPGVELEEDGRATHARGDYVAAVEAYEDAYAAYRNAGDVVSAARAARTVGWFRGWVFGEWAVYRGWLSRARALLEGVGRRGGAWLGGAR